METVIWIIHQLAHYPFQLVILPFASLPPLWAMVSVSFVTALLMLWIYSRVSAQDRIRKVKNMIRGNLLAVRLFQHDIRVVMRLQARILGSLASYLKLSFAPIAVLLVPVVLILVQTNLHFALQPLRPGETTLLEAELTGGSSEPVTASLEAPPGIEVDSPPVRTSSLVSWRIRAGSPGDYRVKVRLGPDTVEKQVLVGEHWQAVSPLRTSSLLDYLLYPGETRIHSNHGIRSIHLKYPSLAIRLLGWDAHWLVLFFLLSVFFSFALKGLFRVEL